MPKIKNKQMGINCSITTCCSHEKFEIKAICKVDPVYIYENRISRIFFRKKTEK